MKKTKKSVTIDSAMPEPAEPTTPTTPKASFPIIGIGASAGGLEAFELFFKTMPVESGMAFVLVPHLDPGHASMLSEILQRNTTMPVHEAQDQIQIQPNHVYIIPPGKDMAIFHGALNLSIPELARGLRLPIDSFFRSLAEDQGERAICVILSGSGSDGTLGLRAIHGAGGVVFVQEPSTAKYDGMPSSAVMSGLATYVLPVEKITEQLVVYVKTIIDTGMPPVPPVPDALSAMRRIMMLLRTKTGNDFSQYKQSTILRRIERRMVVHNVKDMETYARFLQENPAEVHILFKELLINVTSFFRDKEAFDALTKEALPRIFKDKPENYVFRIWVPGCASGEEAYSIAMLFSEYMDEIKQEFKIQIYATDIDDDSIVTARAGKYPTNIAIDVSPDRLRRFFSKEESGFRIKKEIREQVVFAIQNVIKDPPFTKMDLISCRNLLIYLDIELQNRVIPAFHYALNPDGVLFLSPSEGIGNFIDLFGSLDKKWKVYGVKPTLLSARKLVAQRYAWDGGQPGKEAVVAPGRKEKTNFSELSKRVLLQSFAPPSVITDESGNIVYVHGNTGKYLQPAQGQLSTNVIDMAREGLQLDLRLAIQNAITQQRPSVIKDLPVRTNGGIHGVDLTVRPLADPEENRKLLLISFQDTVLPPQEKGVRRKRVTVKGELKRVVELEQDLAYTKENLQAMIEEMQAANEELKSTNEELQSTNEEMQSTNEELETSKEELQSVNEEIVTVNSELQAKIEQLTDIQNDMKNLLENTNIATIFLDDRLSIRRFTHEATKVYRLADSDTGRPLADIRSLTPDVDLIPEAAAVLFSLIPREKQVRTMDNEWYLVRIIPYRTQENVIAGVVLTFSNITALKAVEAALQEEQQFSQLMLDSLPGIFYLYTYPEHQLTRWNKQHETLLGFTADELKGKLAFDWHLPELKDAVMKATEEVMEKGHGSVESNLIAKDGHTIPFFLTGVRFEAKGRLYYMGTGIDITERKRAEKALLKNTEELHASNEELTATDEELRQTIDELGRTELALRSLSTYNRSLIEAGMDPLVTINPDGRIADVNTSTEKVTGYSRKELIGTDFSDYFTEPERAKEGYLRVFAAGTVRDYPLSIKNRDNHITPVLYNASVYRDEAGKVSGVFAAARDITERKQTEELLFKKNEEVRLAGDYAQSIINTVREPLIILNGRFEVISASRAFYDTFKVTPEETQGQVLYTLGNRQWDIPGLHDLLEKVLPENTSFENFEIEHVFPGIGQRTMLLNARRIPGEADTTQLILLAIEDITERKAAEEALHKNTEELHASNEELTATDEELRQTIDELGRAGQAMRESENRYHTLYAQSPIAIELYDVTGALVHANPACLTLFGIDNMQVIQNFSLFADPNITDERKEKLRQGETVQYQGPFDFNKVKTLNLYPTRRDGIIWLDVLITPLGNRPDSVSGFLVQIQDITERKQTEELLFKKNEEVRLAGDYAQSIINTVREPLIVLNGRFEVISASRAFYDTFKVTPEETQGQVLYTLGNRQWDIPRLHDLLETVLPKNRSFENFVVEHAFPGIGQKKMILNAREIIGEEGAPHLILLAMEVVPLHGDKEETGKPGMREGKKD